MNETTAATPRWHLVAAGVGLALLVLAQTFYAHHLHALFYSTYGPFYDSMSYTNRMAQAMQESRDSGFWASFKSFTLNETVILPYLEAALLAPFAGQTRTLGIWLQSIWLLALGLSSLYYLARYRGYPAWVAACLSTMLLSFRGIYDYNGGLSDFRMDLSQYIFFALVAVWYLGTYETESKTPWILAGLFATLGCLTRATLPVHFLITFGPLVLIRLVRGDAAARRRLVQGIAWMAGLPAVIAGAFFLYNFKYLHYYYVIWSVDANANLPLRESIIHLWRLWIMGGLSTFAACLPLLALGLYAQGRPSSIKAWLGSLDWRIGYIGAAPVMFLILRGAGNNPFVSMPSIFGTLLFFHVPVRGRRAMGGRWHLAAAALLALSASFWNARYGPRMHTDVPRAVRMDAVKGLAAGMRADAQRKGKRDVVFATTHIGAVNSRAIYNVMIFDFQGTLRNQKVADASGIEFIDNNSYAVAVPLEWEQSIPGKSDSEKIRHLVQHAVNSVDYLILPDAATLDYIEKELAFNIFNVMTREFQRELLATGRWEPVSAPLQASEVETVILYAKRLPQ